MRRAETAPGQSRVGDALASDPSARRAMATAVLGIAALYVGSTLLTPLYGAYRRQFHISELGVTEV